MTALVAEVFHDAGESLVTLNVKGLAAVCRYIGLPFDYQICSELALPLPADLGPGDWAPAICAALGASDYVNPVGGRTLFDRSEFDRLGVGLHFVQAHPFEYDARQHGTVSNLSILDALMWNAPSVVLDAVRRVSLLD